MCLSATSLRGHTTLKSFTNWTDGLPNKKDPLLITFANPTLPLFSVVLEKRRKDLLRDRNTSEQALWSKLNLLLLFLRRWTKMTLQGCVNVERKKCILLPAQQNAKFTQILYNPVKAILVEHCTYYSKGLIGGGKQKWKDDVVDGIPASRSRPAAVLLMDFRSETSRFGWRTEVRHLRAIDLNEDKRRKWYPGKIQERGLVQGDL